MTNIFDNAESVTIDNNEVQSIKDTDGGVLFEKQANPYSLELTGQASYTVGDTATITGTLTNDGTAVEGEIVTFAADSTTIVTDANIGRYELPSGNYKLTIPQRQGEWGYYIATGTTAVIDKWLTFWYNSQSDPVSFGFEKEQEGESSVDVTMGSPTVYVSGNTMYYIDENGDLATLDVSGYYMTLLGCVEGHSGVVIETNVFAGVTDSNGEVTFSFTVTDFTEVDGNAPNVNADDTFTFTINPAQE